MMAGTITVSLTTVLAGIVIAGCGESESFDVRTQTSTQSTAKTSTPDPTTASGAFKLVPNAPRGYPDLSGTAKLVRSERGTDASITLTGLQPNTQYASHVHAGPCDQPDPGGAHFKFDLNGSDTPPNEIHLPFTSDAGGRGAAEAHNDQTVPEGEGRSIVVHRDQATARRSGGKKASGATAQNHHSSPDSAKSSVATSSAAPPKIACAALK